MPKDDMLPFSFLPPAFLRNRLVGGYGSWRSCPNQLWGFCKVMTYVSPFLYAENATLTI